MPKITLPDNSVRKFDKPISVNELAEEIGAGLAKATVAGKIDGIRVDASELILEDSKVEILTADSEEGLEVVRHSCAHLLAHALKQIYPDIKLAIGPTISDGFYYDVLLDHKINEKDLEKIEAYKEKNEIEEKIINGLYDDLNTPKVIAELNMLTNGINNADVKTKQKIKFNLLEIGKIFGILQENPDTWLGYGQSKNINQDTIERLIKDRNEARRNKNFDMADEIRKKLKEEGVEIEDTSEGTIWRSI